MSVLVPTYRYGGYLDEAIRSVLTQEFVDFELIISDDASLDGSAEKMQAFAQEDRRVRAFVQPRNLGMVQHWNWCLGQAKGEYIKYLFGDDYLATPQALGRLVCALDTHPSAVLATGQRQWVSAQGQTILSAEGMPSPGLIGGRTATITCMTRDRNLIGEPSAVLFRREAGRRGFDVTFRQLVDLEMWYHLLQIGDLISLPDLVLSFRVHSAQQTAQNSRSRIASVETLRLVDRYQNAFRESFIGRSDAEYRREITRVIYYARKQQPPTPEAQAAEQHLINQIGPASYQRHLLLHRLTKPWVNLRRKWCKPT